MTAPSEQVELASWLCGPEGSEAVELALTVTSAGDPLAAADALRRHRPDLSPAQAAGALEQATLRRLARDRYRLDGNWRLTRDGLEAATRPEVAARRAERVAASGAQRVVDLSAGLGSDTRALVEAGLDVTAVERDPVVATFLAHNCPDARVVVGQAQDVASDLLSTLAPTDVVFVDPARRDPQGPRDAGTARARPERDPELWSPPWSWVEGLPHARMLAKVAPGFEPPPSWQAEWVSVDRTVVECAVTSWRMSAHDRQAVVITQNGIETLPGSPGLRPPTGELRAWVHEPDPAVIRAHALAGLAEQEGLTILDPDSTWLTSDGPSGSPALRSYAVIAELTGSPKQQRRALVERGTPRITVKSKDAGLDAAGVLRSLGLREGSDAVVIMTRRRGRVVTLLVEPAAGRGR